VDRARDDEHVKGFRVILEAVSSEQLAKFSVSDFGATKCASAAAILTRQLLDQQQVQDN